MLKIYIIGCVILGAVFSYKPQVYKSDDYPETFNEIPCLFSGGICVFEDDCPDGSLSEVSGLCPVQELKGIECCHGIPKSEKRCRYRGGECMSVNSRCPQNLTYTEAKDCEQDEKCCILVN